MKTLVKSFGILLIIAAIGLIYNNVKTGQTDKSSCTVQICVSPGPSSDRQIVITYGANCTGGLYTSCVTGDDGCCEVQFPDSSATYSATVISAECSNPCTNFVPCLGEVVYVNGNCP